MNGIASDEEDYIFLSLMFYSDGMAVLLGFTFSCSHRMYTLIFIKSMVKFWCEASFKRMFFD